MAEAGGTAAEQGFLLNNLLMLSQKVTRTPWSSGVSSPSYDRREAVRLVPAMPATPA
jgi:hypothetical protein